MVPSSALAVATGGEHLLSDGSSLGETIHFGSLEFITDHFDGLSLSPMGGSSDAIIMGSTRDGPPSSQQTMMGDFIEGSPTTSNGEGRIDLPPPKRQGMGAQPAPATTTQGAKNPSTAQAMTKTLSR
jgi:hypothetical protein